MKALRLTILAAVMAVLAASARPLRGDALGFDLGLHGGVQKSQDGTTNNFIGGAQARIRLFYLLGAEARASYYKDTFESGGKGVTLKNVPYQLSAMLYMISAPGVGLYVLGGGGYYNLKVEGAVAGTTVTVSENKWAAHAGAGLDVKLWKRLWLNGDVRYAFLDVKSLSEAGTVVTSGRKADFWTATAGLNLKLF